MIKKAGGFPARKGILKKKGPAGINLAGPFYCGGVKMFIVDTHTLCTYDIIVKFELDEKKRQTNIIKHRIDFADAIELFKGPSLILEDNRQDYGEERYIAFGIINNRHIALSFTERSGRIRIISMRKANKREQEKYKEAIVDRLEKS